MTKILSGLLGLTLTSVAALTSANAADLYRGGPASMKDAPDFVPVATWTGFYAGVNGGYGFSDTSNDAGLKPEGGFGGGQIGYNWQGALGFGPNFVFGIVTDIQGAGIDDSKGGIKSETDFFGTVRGKVGYSFGRTLVYGTGGFAYGDVKNTVAGLSKSDTETGYVAGGGIEYKINPAWSVGAEYQYINLDGQSGQGAVNFGDTELHTVRATLNYHFGNVYSPLK
jgi:outer membrane immunogenic protein